MVRQGQRAASPALGSSQMATEAELVLGSPTEENEGSACHRPVSAAYLLCDKSLPLERFPKNEHIG